MLVPIDGEAKQDDWRVLQTLGLTLGTGVCGTIGYVLVGECWYLRTKMHVQNWVSSKAWTALL